METKQHIPEQLMGHRRNQKGNQRISQNKLKKKSTYHKPMGRSKSSAKREVYSNISLPQETGNISNKQPNLGFC